MWKATITNIEQDPLDTSTAKVTFDYVNDDGRSKTTIERISQVADVKKIAQNGVNELARIDDVKAFITNPVIGDVFTPILPTPEQTALQAYQFKRQTLITAKQDLDLGLIQQSEYDKVLSDTLTLKPK